MAVTWVQRVPVDRISEKAQELRFWRTVGTLLAGLLWALGWLAARGCALVWRGIAWAAAAAAVGWTDAGRPPGEGGAG